MKKTDIAYIAGLFDGEGCIRINKNSANRNYYTLNVSVKMAWEWMPKYLHLAFGGSIHKYKMDKYYPNAKDQWCWNIRGKEATEFLKAILGYLRVKRAEAELAIVFQSKKLARSDYWGIAHKGKTMRTEEQIVLEEAQYILMKGLKR